MDCARRRISRPRGGGCLGQSVGSPGEPSYQLRRLWIDEPFCVLRRILERRPVALCHMVDVRPQFRSEDWAAYQDVNVRFAAAIDQELAAPPRHLHPRLPSRASSHRRCGAPTRRQDGTVLAHPVAVSGSPAHLSVAAGDFDRAACQRPARFPARTRPAEFPARGGGRRNRDRGVRRAERTPHDSCLHRSASTSTASSESQRIRRSRRNRNGWSSRSVCARPSSGSASIAWITQRASLSGSPHSTRITQRPELRGRMTFVQIGVPSRSELASYSAIENEISHAIDTVNRATRWAADRQR